MRQAHGYSLEQLAVLTRLRPERIAALEHDDFVHAPFRAYIVGHIRVYARGLGEDPTPALDALMLQLGPPAGDSAADESRDSGWTPGRNQLPYLPAALGVVILIVALVLIARNNPAAESAESVEISAPAVAAVAADAVAASELVVSVTADREAFLEAIVDGEVVFSSLVAAGEFHTWTGSEAVRLKSDDGGALRIQVDGDEVGDGLTEGRELDRTWFPSN
jgi:cytoskeleton protein RodZ